MGVPRGDRELVQIMDAAFADAARRAGERLVCRPGCTQCCHGAFAINRLDVLRLREGMGTLERKEPAVAAEIKRRAEEWIAFYGADFPGDLETGVLGTRDEDRSRFEEYADDAPCPALNPETGLCDVYEWRPMTCRVFGPPVRMEAPDGSSGLGHCELCFEGAGTEEIAACEMQVPHDLEKRIIDELGEQGETIVAFAVLR
jgi:Fe-S-cluster containining protein